MSCIQTLESQRVQSINDDCVDVAEDRPRLAPPTLDPVLPDIESPNNLGPAERYVKVAIMLVAVVLCGIVAASGRFGFHYSLWPNGLTGKVFWITAFFYGGLMYAVLVWRVILWRRYRPMPSVADHELPRLSVIVPAFNEGELVRQSILSVAASNYPADRLEIIAVDDGSTDDTWLHILTAAREAAPRVKVTTLRLLKNQGKRRALQEGFQRGVGDVFISIDSDSILDPDALRNGVTPLVRDPSIGCVAGCVQVLNPRQSIVTRFLKCTFSLSFKFVRAYQSEFRGVFCTPGALSVYRADVVRKVVDEWANQKFLGLPCAIGEDRAMTNLFLREGWLTVYQGNAVVWSKMPHTYIGLCKMLLRWGRSNIRETIVLFRFLFKNFRGPYLNTFRFNMILTAATLFLPPFMIANSTLLLFTSYGFLMQQIGMVLLYSSTMSIIYYINERDSDWIWLFLYEILWIPCLSWIIPYSTFTLRNIGWLTRGAEIHAKPAPHARPAHQPRPAHSQQEVLLAPAA